MTMIIPETAETATRIKCGRIQIWRGMLTSGGGTKAYAAGEIPRLSPN